MVLVCWSIISLTGARVRFNGVAIEDESSNFVFFGIWNFDT